MRFIFKAVKNTYISIITILALPFALVFLIMGRLAIYAGAYSEVSIIVSKIPFLFGQIVRYYYYKATLQKLGKNVTFKYGSFCQYPSARIGNRVLIGYYNAIGEVEIGDDVVIGGFVNFISGTTQHSFEDQTQTISNQKALGRSMITIGSDIWIGSNAVIASSIGNRCVIGAGSVLVKPAEDQSVYAGNPAKLIKKI
ncbi:acyltransferase [Pedobacter polaris]|uniref:Acyltransferase n=1 Tax=Pedobacter polaris TaxID=2571273 RepID=A0A4U1CXG1_9SPHI|nr:acyltransferase [Pedobacter polaris]TKC13070.1 acyltransferase [Pedobacter polaris]